MTGWTDDDAVMADLRRWLVKRGYVVLSDFYDADHFGNQVVELARPVAIALIRDRSQWRVELCGRDGQWRSLGEWGEALGHGRPPVDRAAIDEARQLRELLAEIERNPGAGENGPDGSSQTRTTPDQRPKPQFLNELVGPSLGACQSATMIEMADTGTGNGKVVVNRAMSLDGFIAGPGDTMDWILDVVPQDVVAEVAAATGALLVGRRTSDVGDRMAAEEPAGGDYPFSGRTFLLTHRPPDPPDPRFTVLSGDIGEAVATALKAAGGKNLEILGADVAAQALRRGLVDEILVYVLPVILGAGVPFSPAGSVKVDLDPISSTQSGAVTVLRFRVRK